MSPKETLDLAIKASDNSAYETFAGLIKKLANVGEISFVTEKVDSALSFVILSDEFFIPMEEGAIDVEAEKAEMEKEIEYTKDQLNYKQ